MKMSKEDIFNPNRQFKSTTELYNYIKKEYTDKNIEGAMKAMDKPISVIDPKVHHTVLVRTLEKIPQFSMQQRKWISLLKARSAIVTQNSLRGVKASWMDVTNLLAGWLECRAHEVEEEEHRALDYVRTYLDNNDLGTGAEVVQT